MALATYNDLVSAIADWLHRDDLTPRIGDFISLAETKLNRVIRIPRMWAATTLTAPDTGEVDLPNDLLELIRVRKPEGEYLSRTAVQVLDETAKRRPTETLYAIRGRQLLIRPKPASGNTTDVVVEYYARPLPLGPSNPSNLWLELAPDALLYGALVEASAYLYDDPRVPVWKQRFQEAMAAVQTAHENDVNTPQYGLRYPPANGVV